MLPGRNRVARAQLAAEPARQIRGWPDPGDADEHDGRAHDERVADEADERFALQRAQNPGKLEADCDEDETVEQKHDHLPKGKRLQTVAGAGDERGVPAEKNPGCNRGEHARNVQPFSREISEERSEQ